MASPAHPPGGARTFSAAAPLRSRRCPNRRALSADPHCGGRCGAVAPIPVPRGAL